MAADSAERSPCIPSPPMRPAPGCRRSTCRTGGRAGSFHVILARAWAPDIHYVRDVALATTREL